MVDIILIRFYTFSLGKYLPGEDVSISDSLITQLESH